MTPNITFVFLRFVMGVFLMLGACPVEAQQKYYTSLTTLSNLATDVQRMLKPGLRTRVAKAPLRLEQSADPTVRLLGPKVGQTPRLIGVSAGMLDTLIAVSHAEAIDTKKRRYFRRFVESQEAKEAVARPRELPDWGKSDYWSEEVMNEQISNFNSMAGILVSITMAQQYLGLHEKYARPLASGKGPLNELITEAEFEKVFLQGIRNALEVGIGTEGLQTLFYELDRLDVRPEWASYFLPESADCRKLRKEMRKMEDDFFSGRI